jgi:phosphoinositide-3-kinase, regulatory subunit 4
VEDKEPRVRVAAIDTLSNCLKAVTQVPCSDANVFPEYILPNLANVIDKMYILENFEYKPLSSQVYQDESVLVRAAYAAKISELAETALR